MKTAKLIIAALATSVSSTGAFAQDAELESLAREYFSVLQTDGMTAVGRFMHPDALRDFKEMLLPVFEISAEAGQNDLMSFTFGPAMTVDGLKQLEPTEFMNGFMNIVAAQTGDVQMSFDALEVLGVVAEGNQRHVLTRITIGANELEVTQFEVLSFVPFEGSWRLQLNGQMKGLAAALLGSMGGQ